MLEKLQTLFKIITKKRELIELRHRNGEMFTIIPQCDITLVWGLFL